MSKSEPIDRPNCPICHLPMIFNRNMQRSRFACAFSSDEMHRSQRRIDRINRQIEMIERSINR